MQSRGAHLLRDLAFEFAGSPIKVEDYVYARDQRDVKQQIGPAAHAQPPRDSGREIGKKHENNGGQAKKDRHQTMRQPGAEDSAPESRRNNAAGDQQSLDGRQWKTLRSRRSISMLKLLNMLCPLASEYSV